MAFLLGVLGGVAALFYLNKVGLPELVKRPLLAQLRARGLDVYFSRLRLHWYRGIVAENINLGQTASPLGPQLFIDEAEVHLNHAALWRLQWRVEALVIRKGRFCYPLPVAADSPAAQFNLEEIAAELAFLEGDRWEIRHLEAVCLGAKVKIHGLIDHATGWRQWRQPAAPGDAAPAARRTAFERSLRGVLETMGKVQFSGVPRLDVDFSLDTREAASLKTALNFLFEGASTPWGQGSRLLLTLQTQASATNREWLETQIRLRADQWQGTNFLLRKPSVWWHLTHAPELAGLRRATGELSAARLALPMLTVDNLQMKCQAQAGSGPSNWTAQARLGFEAATNAAGRVGKGELSGAFTIDPRRPRPVMPARPPAGIPAFWAKLPQSPWWPVTLEAEVGLTGVETRWGTAGQLRGRLTSTLRAASEARADDGWSYWAWLEPFQLDWRGETWDVKSPQLAVDRLEFAGAWNPPLLLLPRLEAHLYQGHFQADARLNVATREAVARGASSFDVHQVALLLNTNGQRWLRQYGWELPPLARARVAVVLPAWTNSRPNWRGEVLPTMRLDGYVEGGGCSFRGAGADAARLHFSCEHGSWHIPDLRLERPEGAVALAYAADVPTQDFYWKVRSGIDPRALRPLLEPASQRALGMFEFTSPPVIAGDVWGRWHAVDRLGFAVQLALTNFMVRGETADRLEAGLGYTNAFLGATNIHVRRGEGTIDAPGVSFDAAKRGGGLEATNRGGTLYFTNVAARIDPAVVTRVIGPKTAAALEPYQFGQPPRVLVNGSMIVPGPDEADMAFTVAGGPFRYSRFNLPEVSGLVLWQGDSLTISNFQGVFYKGEIKGTLDADMHSTNGSDIAFQLGVKNVDAAMFLRDMSTNANKVEGVLSGQLAITHLNSQDWLSWFGYGKAQIRQGVIWDLPLFGFLSKPLNTIADGLGSSRFEQGEANFLITNSVIQTRDLEIRSPLLRLKCDGTGDFDQRINVRMEVELFRDVWLPFRVLHFVTVPFNKAFEYKVTGTLRQPKAELLWIPKVLVDLLHPFRTLKGVFAPATPAAPATAPAAK